jgi:hypothetical protein
MTNVYKHFDRNPQRGEGKTLKSRNTELLKVKRQLFSTFNSGVLKRYNQGQ